MFRPALRSWLLMLGVGVLSSLTSVSTQSGPSPEMRALLDAFRTALNGTSDSWETFARETFSPDLLRKQSADERRQWFERLRSEFGNLDVGRVTRSGPGAPLAIHVTGSTGVTGLIGLDVNDASTPRIVSLTLDAGGSGAEPGGDALPRPPIDGRMSNEDLVRALDDYLTKLAVDDVYSGVALVARGGIPVFHKAYGFADRANRRPNAVGTRFNLGSINKAFTQVAVRQLVREGKMALNDTLGKFFPDYPQAASRVATIEQLLTHRGGLSDFFGQDFTGAAKDRFRSNADYFRFIGTLPPRFAPGTRSEYCNGCYIALGAIIEATAGMPYERFVAEQVFAPAGMTNTGYPHSDALEPDVATGYTRRTPDGALRSNIFMHGAAGSAAGGGYSTSADLLAFVNAVRAGRFPGTEPEMGIGGGAPGINAAIETNGDWTAIVLTNLDPPAGGQIASAIVQALRR